MLDWERIGRAALHPLQVTILEDAYSHHLVDERFSPVELARKHAQPLGNVSYHVRQLAKLGLIKPAGTAPSGGSIQHYYKLSETALVKKAK